MIVLDVSTDANLLNALASVSALPFEVARLLEQHPTASTAPHIWDWAKPVGQCLEQHYNLSQATQGATKYLSDGAMYSLSFAGWLLGQDGRRMPAEEETQNLVDMLQELEEAVLQPDVDGELRLYLLEHIRGMHNAIRLVQVRGADALRDAAETGLGGGLFWVATRTRNPLVDRLWDIGGKAATVAQLLTTGVAIAPAVLRALPG